MILGIPSLIEMRTVKEQLKFARENGFSFFEMNLSFPWFQSDKIDEDLMVKLGKEYAVGYTIHLHDQLNPFDFSPEIREGGMKSIEYAINLAQKTGAKRLTLHLQNGMYSSVAGKKIYAYEVCLDEYLSHVETMASLVSSRLSGSDIFFCIENTSGFRSYHKKAIEQMLSHNNFGLTFDVGHNFKASEDDEAFIMSHRDKIRHFHIHDVTEKANHVALGTGLLDIKKYMNLVKELNCPAVIEVKESSALKESLKYLK
ncbi:MAG: sugar phosphate isomerase/epimerase [Sphaerochaetaceae bacterium]|nr:sugar phosphate isomerase/epimerase [Sphaerochaetaceae bacterium]